IIVTYDENGGLWDHVAPPAVDHWGPGTRIPAIIISPFAKRGFVDHTVYDTTSILKFIETRHGLVPLGDRDAAAATPSNALGFGTRALPGRRGRQPSATGDRAMRTAHGSILLRRRALPISRPTRGTRRASARRDAV